jgi:RHH-type rel operon transcriptional repressor/antitoxin RelB
MNTKTLNVRVPEDLYSQIEALATATARTKSFVMVEALKGYVESESWQIQDIHEGIREADAGQFASPEEVNAVFAKHGA